jgi:integrase
MRLTVRSVESTRPSAYRREIPDSLLSGLYLIVHPTGGKAWAVRYRHHRVSRKLTLGSYPALGLKDARELAAKALRAVAEGRDPAHEKIEARYARIDSIDSVIAEYLERHARRATRPKTAAETERILQKNVLPYLCGRLITDITRRDVISILDRVIDAGTPVAANRTLAAVRGLFNWAVSRDILTVSPCMGVKRPATEQARDRVLSDDELRDVWLAAEQVGYPVGSLIKLLVLTGQRRNEVGLATWSEVNLKGRLWRLPPERTKNGKASEVPLSAAAIELLQSLPRFANGNYVFTSDGTTPSAGFSRHKRRLDALLPPDMPKWTLHDLRRTAASGLARLGVALPTIERLLNHTSGASFRGVAGIYQRYDFAAEKAKACELWSQYVLGLASKKATRLRETSRG